MHIEHFPHSTSLDINITYHFANMTVQPRGMDIGTILNPAVDHPKDLEMKDEEDGEDEEDNAVAQEQMESHCQLQFHTRPTPIEVGGYAQPYPSPANSPDQKYSAIAGAPGSHGPQQAQFLPSFGQMTEMLHYPSPPPTIVSLNADFLSRSNSVSHHCRPRQIDSRHPSPHSRPSSHRPHSAPSYSYRVNRADCDSPRRASHTPKASTQRRQQLQRAPVLTQSSITIKTPGPAHSNQPYTRPQVHFIRYWKIDRVSSWKHTATLFNITFKGQRADTVTEGGASSRSYRHNLIPELDVHGRVMYKAGKLKMLGVKVRTRNKGENANAPWAFVERHPWAALTYDWVLPEHKAEAARIIAEIENTDPNNYTRKSLPNVPFLLRRMHADYVLGKQQYIVAIRDFELGKLAHSSDDGELVDADEELEEDWEAIDKQLLAEARERPYNHSILALV
jgi:hypothetical protein